MDGSLYRPAPPAEKPFPEQVAAIADEIGKRGCVLMRAGEVVGSLEADTLAKAMLAAHENTRTHRDRHDHVLRLVRGIVAKLGVRGGVQVPQAAWNQIEQYAVARRMRSERPASAGKGART